VGDYRTPTSKFFYVDPDELVSYLSRQQLEFKIQGTQVNVKICPFCHDTKNRADNLWKLYLSRESGAYFCHRCGGQGSWFDFKKATGGLPEFYDVNGKPVSRSRSYVRPDQNLASAYPTALQYYPDVPYYLNGQRKLTPETIKAYRVGASMYHFQNKETGEWGQELAITFPWIVYEKNQEQILRVKARSLANKSNMMLDPAGGAWGLFGWHLIPNDAREIVVTEGEFDAMSVYQATGIPAVSLPNGARSLPPELIPWFDRFERVVFWMDDDTAGHEGAIGFSRKLGIRRCWFIQTRQGRVDGPKDANEALQRGFDLNKILATAQPIPHDAVIHLSQLKSEVLREILDADQLNGMPYDLSKMNEILKGHRHGELTVFTGPTGSGKTTVLGQLSMGLAKHGEHTLWGSFEIVNKRLAKKMFTQFVGKNFGREQAGEFEFWWGKYEKLPIWFMTFFGATHVDQVIDAMEYAVYQLDVKHIVLDNLQFMMGDQVRGANKFDWQDQAIDRFRKFTSTHQTHTTLVIHPKKIGDFQEIDTGNLGGTAKATQECDNFIVLQKGLKYRYLDIKKNRFDGDVGEVPFVYEKGTGGRIRELTETELEVNTSENQAGERASDRAGVYNSNRKSFADRYGQKRQIRPKTTPQQFSPGVRHD